MKKRILSLFMVIVMLSAFGFTVNAEENNDVSSPNGKIKITFNLSAEGEPSYTVTNNDYTLIEKSALGLSLSTGDLKTGFTLGNVSQSNGNSEWHPIAGDKETVKDIYNEKTFTLNHSSGKTVKIQMRAYDSGAAFRYILPEGTYTVNGEFTEYAFPAETYGEMHIGTDKLSKFGIETDPVYTHLHTNATVPKKVKAENFEYNAMYYMPSGFQYKNGMALTICEGNLDNYVRMRLSGSNKTRTLRTVYYRALDTQYGTNADPNANSGGFAEVKNADPAQTPWRVFVIGDEVKNLPENADIVTNLNEPADEDTYKFSEWVKPGAVLRTTNFTDKVKEEIDNAEKYGYQYIHLDTGWYGAEYDRAADPRLDPDLLGENDPFRKWIVGDGKFKHTTGFDTYQSTSTPGNTKADIDIPEICRYGKEKGVGIILYFNAEIFARKETNTRNINYEDIFKKFEEWGVAGAKPGFSPYGTQANEKLMQDLIECAARHKLVLTMHDEYVRTGTERTFPNCLTTEAIYGDEAIGRYTSSKQIAEDITTLFTRLIQGPADHTYCYPGKATKAYALASPILFKSGLHYLYWYANTATGAAKSDNISVWYNLPAEWDELKVIEAELEGYATYARRNGSTWYIGSLSAKDRQLNVPLDFLDSNKTYTAEIWADEIGADAYAQGGINDVGNTEKMKQKLIYSKELVTNTTTLTRPLGYGNGYAVRIKEATQDEKNSLPTYKTNAQEITYLLTDVEDYSNSAGKYDAAAWTAFETAKKAAEDAYKNNATMTDTEVSEICGNLRRAIGGLVDVSELTSKVNFAERIPGKVYSATARKNLATAIEKAKTLLAADYKTEADITGALTALQKAIDNCTLDTAEVTSSVWLDELDWESYNVYNNVCYKNKDYYSGDGKMKLRIDGTDKEVRGVFIHAINQGEAYVQYDLSKKDYDYIEGYVGIDTDKLTAGDVIFKFYGDGKLIYQTLPSLANFKDNAQFVRVPVKGVKELKLVADSNGPNSSDWAVFGDMKFTNYEYTGNVYTFSDYTGGAANGFTLFNGAQAVSEKGVYSRKADDVSVAMKAVKNRGNQNPYLKKDCGETAESGQYIYTGISFAAENGDFNNFGLGGKLICDYTDNNGELKKDQQVFMNGTAIMAENGKIYAFGNEVCAFETKKWYSIDVYVNPDTNCETVYVNGNLVLDNVAIKSTLQVQNQSWKLKGFVDLRLTALVPTDKENVFYYDDISYGIMNSIKVNPGLTSKSFDIKANSIILAGVVTSDEQVKNGLNVPSGAVLDCTMKYARLENADKTSYVYYVTGGGKEYDFNDKTSIFSGGTVTYADKIGGKAANDFAVTTTGTVNAYPDEVALAEGEKIVIETDILAENVQSAHEFSFEPWFDGNPTNLFTIYDGQFKVTSKTSKEIVRVEPNKWYHMAVVYSYNSDEVKIYVNNKDYGTYKINSKVKTFKRIKYVGKSGVYVDNVRWYKGEYVPYSEPTIASGDKYCTSNGKLLVYEKDMTVKDLKEMLNINGSVYTDSTFKTEAADNDVVTDNMYVAVRTDTHIAYYAIVNAATASVKNVKFVCNDASSTVDGEGTLKNGKYTLSADFVGDKDGANYTMYIVRYNNGRLYDVIKKPVTVDSKNPYVQESVEFTYKGEQDTDQIKAFIWDEYMNPASKAFSAKK